MKKQLILRSLLGMPLGVAISTLCTLVISAWIGDGGYYPVTPQLTQVCGSPLTAMAVQTATVMAYGAIWGGASVIWEVDRWSLLRQTATHFCLTAGSTFPIAWFLNWMEHSLAGAAIYFGIFFAIYAVIWAGSLFLIRRRLKDINRRLKN